MIHSVGVDYVLRWIQMRDIYQQVEVNPCLVFLGGTVRSTVFGPGRPIERSIHTLFGSGTACRPGGYATIVGHNFARLQQG